MTKRFNLYSYISVVKRIYEPWFQIQEYLRYPWQIDEKAKVHLLGQDGPAIVKLVRAVTKDRLP